jgi:hypothetical protein
MESSDTVWQWSLWGLLIESVIALPSAKVSSTSVGKCLGKKRVKVFHRNTELSLSKELLVAGEQGQCVSLATLSHKHESIFSSDRIHNLSAAF